MMFGSETTNLLQRLQRQLKWSEYEVDPEWARFCSFGPEDMGGPWEKLGIIRQKKRVERLYVSPDVMEMIKCHVEALNGKQCFPFSPGAAMGLPELRSVFGVPVQETNYLPPGSCMGWASAPAMVPMFTHANGIVREGVWPVSSFRNLIKTDGV